MGSDEGLTVGDDGVARCAWGASSPEYRAYHDQEWGRPVDDDAAVYEHLCLEGFQCGLSWLTVLRKRDALRRAFASFDPHVVASFGDADVERLCGDPSVVRHRAKIQAAVGNARATVALEERGASLAALVWAHRPEVEHPPTCRADVPASTPESAALSRTLRALGFTFVGPKTAYAAMQSLGVVNDHLVGCRFREVAEEERRARAGSLRAAGPAPLV